MQGRTGTLSERGADAALAMHTEVVGIYERAWNAHTLDFEKDLGRFMAPDITVVAGDMLGGRSMLAEISDARAEYVRFMDAIVTLDFETTYVADLDTTAVVVTEGEFSFTYPDQTAHTQPLLASCTLRMLDGMWVFQHIHFGRDSA